MLSELMRVGKTAGPVHAASYGVLACSARGYLTLRIAGELQFARPTGHVETSISSASRDLRGVNCKDEGAKMSINVILEIGIGRISTPAEATFPMLPTSPSLDGTMCKILERRRNGCCNEILFNQTR